MVLDKVIVNLLLLFVALPPVVFREVTDPLNDRSNRTLALFSEVILRLSYDERKTEHKLVLNWITRHKPHGGPARSDIE